MARVKIKYEDACGEVKIAYAELESDTESVWCFKQPDSEFGFTIFKSEIIKIYSKRER